HDGLSDASGVASTTTAELTVNPEATAPDVSAVASTISEDGTSALTITLNNAAELFENGDDSVSLTVTLSDGATLNGAGVTDNMNGSFSLTVTAADQLAGLTITPVESFEGTVAIGVSATAHDGLSDASGVASTTTAELTVNPEATAPDVSAVASTISEDGTSALTITLNNAAELFENGDDSVSLTVTLSDAATLNGAGVTDNMNGSFSLTVTAADQLAGLTITPVESFEGTVAIGVSATAHDGLSDPSGVASTTTAELTVNPEATAPDVSAVASTISEDGTSALTLTLNNAAELFENGD